MKLVPKKVFFWNVKNHGSIACENKMKGSLSRIQVRRFSATCGSVFFGTFSPERCNALVHNERKSCSFSSDNSGLISIPWFLFLGVKAHTRQKNAPLKGGLANSSYFRLNPPAAHFRRRPWKPCGGPFVFVFRVFHWTESKKSKIKPPILLKKSESNLIQRVFWRIRTFCKLVAYSVCVNQTLRVI